MLLAAREMLVFCQSRSTCNILQSFFWKCKSQGEEYGRLQPVPEAMDDDASKPSVRRQQGSLESTGGGIYQQHMRNEATKIRSKAAGD
jgi:hypothetical protein